MKTPRLKIGRTYSRNGLALRVLERLAPRLYLVTDHAGMHRLHTGARDSGFRGYVSNWHTPKLGACFRVDVFVRPGQKTRRLARTLAGAVRSMKHHATKGKA